jgi:DNA adenine methylase
MKLQAPFPWFGGKSRVADIVWSRFGDVRNYVEPFFGSGAVLLGRPRPFDGTETVNDLDGFVANFWRAIKLRPKETAEWASDPVNENDLHARHAWLIERRKDLVPMLEGDPDFCDPKIAGWWCWGICCWIGSGWCTGNGPWAVVDGKLTKQGASRGVNRQLVHLGSAGMGVNRKIGSIEGWFIELSARLASVRVCSGDWSRMCGPSITFKHGLTAVFLDPPYADTAGRCEGVYAEDSVSVAHSVREWAIENGSNPKLRIALCGYDGEHAMPGNWECVPWKAKGGYASQGDGSNKNAGRERVWFSPHCLKIEKQGVLL